MVDRPIRTLKPLGRNVSPKKGKSTAGGRPQQQQEQPQAPTWSSTDDYHSANSALANDDTPMPALILSGARLVNVQKALAESERRARPARKRTHTTLPGQERPPRPLHNRTNTTTNTTPNTKIPSYIFRNQDETTAQASLSSLPSSPTSSEDWEQIPEPGSTAIPCTPPFPGKLIPLRKLRIKHTLTSHANIGTWPAALHDTTAALTQVSRASWSFGSALTKSGIGKASWSVGAAALSSTNQVALSVAGWGIKKTGIMPNELPRPVARWITDKEEKERRRRRIEERRRRHSVEYGQALEGSFRDQQGEFGVVLHEMDSTGEFRGRGPPGSRESESRHATESGQETEMDGWDAERMRARAREDGEYEEGCEEEEGYGLTRMFEFDEDDYP